MKIKDKIDYSYLRLESESTNRMILDLLMEKLDLLSSKEGERPTLFTVCPNSEMVLKAAIRSAKRADAPILFATTLNQVDTDRGYTGWVQDDLVNRIKEEYFSKKMQVLSG